MYDLIVMSVVVAFIGFSCTVFVLVKMIRELCDGLAKTNEQLMIMVTSKEGNIAGARALVASAKSPLKNSSGLTEEGNHKKKKQKAEKEQEGLKITMGVN